MAMGVNNMRDLALMELAMCYGSEQQLDDALPGLSDGVETEGLRSDLDIVKSASERQQRRLEDVFRQMGEEPKGTGATVAETIIDHMQGITTWKAQGLVKDAALISAVQQYLHYQIACYGTLRAHAHTMGREDAAQILTEALHEAHELDEMLKDRAMNDVNPRALQEAPARAT